MHDEQQHPWRPPASGPPVVGDYAGQAAGPSGSHPFGPRNRLLIAAAIFAGLVVFGAGIGIGTVASLLKPTTAPSACVESIDRADDLITQTVGTITLSQQATEAAAAQDVEALESIGRQIEARTPEVRAARAAFDAASEECRSGE